MAELTIGQRIAEERKKLGLSQVGLATRLDVSRQAISKWEADAAIPEIDKLIALSKLFGVTVGWLLGVEEQIPQREESLSENQLRMVEELVRKYQMPPAPRLSAFHYMFAIAVSLLVFLFIFSQTSRIEKYLQTKVDVSTYNTLAARVAALENPLSLNAQTGTLLASYSFDVLPTNDKSDTTPKAKITFTAVPNIWNTGDAGYLYLRNANAESLQISCRWDGSHLSATVDVDTVDGYESCFIVEHENGSQEQQILEDDTIHKLGTAFTIPMEVTPGKWNYSNGVLTFSNVSGTFRLPEICYRPHDEVVIGPALVACEYYLDCKYTDSTAIETLIDDKMGQIEDSPKGIYVFNNQLIQFRDLNLENMEYMALWFRVQFSNGMSQKKLINVYKTDGNGSITEY